MTDEIRSAKAKFDDESQRCNTFMDALKRLEQAQKRVRCEVTFTLFLSGFLQAEITKRDLQRKRDHVKRLLNDELREAHALSRLLTESLTDLAVVSATPASLSATASVHGELVAIQHKEDGRRLLPRCQNMPDEAFAPPALASDMYHRQKREVHVLSYGWRTPGQASEVKTRTVLL